MLPPSGWLRSEDTEAPRDVLVEWKGQPVLLGEIGWLPEATEPGLIGTWFKVDSIYRVAKVGGVRPGPRKVILFDQTAGAVVGLEAPYRERVVDVPEGGDRFTVSLP